MNIIKFILFNIIAWVIGKVWVFACIPFRAYARSVVYNYVLQNKLPLKRLWQRNPLRMIDGSWELEDVHYIKALNDRYIKGHIKYRKVSKLQFYLVVLFIWGWLDDDSNADTTDLGYIKTLQDGSRKSWHVIFRPFLNSENFNRGHSDVVHGNSFDLGDTRAKYSYFKFFNTFVWNSRNTAMNFKYLWMDY